MEGLEDKADMPGARRGAAVLVQRRELDAIEPDRALARLVEAGEQRDQRGLAGAGGPDHGDGLAGRDLEADVVQDGQHSLGAGNLLAQTPGFEHCLSVHAPRPA